MSEHESTAEKDAPRVEVQWAVDLGFAVCRATDEDHARKWVKSYEDHPDAVEEGDPMPVVVRRTITTTAWTRVVRVLPPTKPQDAQS
jgi:hypothetical protein